MIEINISIISLIISSISLLYSLILIFSRFLTYENDNYKECLIYVINGIILVSYSYYISNNKYIFLNYEYTYNVCFILCNRYDLYSLSIDFVGLSWNYYVKHFY